MNRERQRVGASKIALLLMLLGLGVIMVCGITLADWIIAMPIDAKAEFVGGQTCIQCHQHQYKLWKESHHDLAMDLATDETVLGDFNDARIEHAGIESRMYREQEKYMVHTEGPDGTMADFHVKYVFGVEPLQQYMVEFDRPDSMPSDTIAKLQVLRISWDTEKKRWFYLSPPDVDEKLAPSDPLHWTKAGQNWNHMCASCHSTNLRKNFELASNTYHTTFTDIDVHCEACHGPGSIHVKLANAKSLFWDRNLGYGLRRIKGKANHVEVETCAPCHSRRRVVHPDQGLSTSFYHSFSNELLRPQTYYADGQIKDEVYVYGSFIQSKMFHKDIKCSDCHDPHSTRLKHQGNAVCTSCHQHPIAKYDNEGHHHHRPGSPGSFCVDCHMPQTPFMDVDLRRDHSLRIPRPDLSVKHKTPNACTGCHLERDHVDAAKQGLLPHYADWLVNRENDKQIEQEIQRVDKWSADWTSKWYSTEHPEHFVEALAAAWAGNQGAGEKLKALAQSRSAPGIVRASALLHLTQFSDVNSTEVAVRKLDDKDPQVRLAALGVIEFGHQTARNYGPQAEMKFRKILIDYVQPRLKDKARTVRIEAARVLAGMPMHVLSEETKPVLSALLQEYRDGVLADSDQAGTHMALALLEERIGAANARDQVAWRQQAIQHYRNAIRVQPDVTGPRSNLVALLEAVDPNAAEITKLRREELALLERDASLAPDEPTVQYRYGLSLYLNGKVSEAAAPLRRAVELAPEITEFRYLLTLLLFEKLGELKEANEHATKLLEIRPQDPAFLQLKARVSAGQGR